MTSPAGASSGRLCETRSLARRASGRRRTVSPWAVVSPWEVAVAGFVVVAFVPGYVAMSLLRTRSGESYCGSAERGGTPRALRRQIPQVR